METYLKQTPGFDISYDPEQQTVFVISNLQFNWLNAPFTNAWTDMEKSQYINQITRYIWGSWNNNVNLSSVGKSSFFKSKQQQLIPVVFSTQVTTGNPHWSIEINKGQKGDSLPAYVQWSTKKIYFTVEDTARDSGNSMYGSNSEPENDYWGMHAYEFSNANSFNSFTVGNVGIELRETYLDQLLTNINDQKEPLIPKTKFSLSI